MLSMNKELPLNEIIKRIGTKIGYSDWFTINQDRINRFADCTEDHQWIHVDPDRAASSPFSGTIAHGFLTLSLIPHLCRDLFICPAGTLMTINYGFNRVRMISPVPVGADIRDVVVLKNVEVKEDGRQILFTDEHTIEIKGAAKPACVAQMLYIYLVNQPS
jgi:acyl dehydratase